VPILEKLSMYSSINSNLQVFSPLISKKKKSNMKSIGVRFLLRSSKKQIQQDYFTNLTEIIFPKKAPISLKILLSLGSVLVIIACANIKIENFTPCFLSITSNAEIFGLSFDAKAILHVAWLGLITGCLHTLAGPDHLAALTPLTIGQTRITALVLGALWGLGHSVGQVVLGLAFVMLKDKFGYMMPAFNKYGGILIGATLVIIGIIGIHENVLTDEEFHDSIRDEKHISNLQKSPFNKKPMSFNQGIGTLFTGIIYGLNPDTLLMLVPALALPSKIASFAYILMFVNGTIIAMSLYTFAISFTTEVLGRKAIVSNRNLSIAASIIAILFGGIIIISGIGVSFPFKS
jgi:hypothetical protein